MNTEKESNVTNKNNSNLEIITIITVVVGVVLCLIGLVFAAVMSAVTSVNKSEPNNNTANYATAILSLQTTYGMACEQLETAEAVGEEARNYDSIEDGKTYRSNQAAMNNLLEVMAASDNYGNVCKVAVSQAGAERADEFAVIPVDFDKIDKLSTVEANELVNAVNKSRDELFEATSVSAIQSNSLRDEIAGGTLKPAEAKSSEYTLNVNECYDASNGQDCVNNKKNIYHIDYSEWDGPQWIGGHKNGEAAVIGDFRVGDVINVVGSDVEGTYKITERNNIGGSREGIEVTEIGPGVVFQTDVNGERVILRAEQL